MQSYRTLPRTVPSARTLRFLTASLAILIGVAAATAPAVAADFGKLPSGDVPIFFNDHTVYAKPDILRRSRVLAALVKDGQIYVPLRSMFEAMGATVSAASGGKTITAQKPGSSVSVMLGKAVVVINGETRPLDVPPMLYKGVVLVPVRVISEALGAYVAWLPERRVVVVRYLAAPAPVAPTPAPAPAPTVAPIAVPTAAPAVATPVPAPKASSYTVFLQAAFSHGKNYNEFSAGEFCPESYVLSGAYAPPHSALAVKVDFRQDAYVTSDNLTDGIGNHYTHFSTIDGGAAYTPVFLARQSTLDARLLVRVADPHVYVGVGYLSTANNYGYPKLTGIGVGIEKLPDLRAGLNFFGSAFYYPAASGNYTIANAASSNNGTTYKQEYRIVKYDVGLALAAKRSPLYLYGGVDGDRYAGKQHAPIGQTHGGPYLGLGVKL